MSKEPLIVIVLAILVCLPWKMVSQTDSTAAKKDTIDFYDMSLEQLLKMRAHGVPNELEKLINSLISVASKKPLNTRESPSIISLITADDILKSGARDLIDVLRTIPGLDFGVDVEGVVGVGIRGNWAHEGKMLLLVDGLEMNEILFGTTQFGNHYPLDLIKRIEVIRGPGSAIYGGFAEYGVINIITKQGEDLNGISTGGIYGQGQNDYLHRNAYFAIGNKVNDFEYSFMGHMGDGQRSDQDYTDFYDSTYNMARNSNIKPNYFSASLKYKGLSYRWIGDYYNTSMKDGYGDVVPGIAVQETFRSTFHELKYVINPNKKLSITPRFTFKSQTPWSSKSYTGKEAYNRTATRALGNLTASYNLNRYVNFVLGAEYYQDKAMDHEDSSYFSNGKQEVSYNNYAFFTQGLIKTRPVNFIVGARYDKHNVYGDAFVPRVGLTKKYGAFHFKALYSNSFRAPSIENVNGSPDSLNIKPELTKVAELELGYKLGRRSIISVNLFDITTNDPIVYKTDSNNADIYVNEGGSGTKGVEAEYKLRFKKVNFSVNYAFYTAANKKQITDYSISNASSDTSALLAFAKHRVNFSAIWNPTEKLSINLNASLYGSRWAYTSVDSTDTSALEELPSTVLLNLFINWEPVDGLNIGLGCYDILNQKFNFIQPYNGYHPPLPGPSREIVFKLQYNLRFKAKNRKVVK
ncbi:MAG: TonB-dependent receptor plug domain-containing protein [Bacteroidota bacterium]|nr:TonB-dependent receptor plug domain-containing protein [Bacteroidota bacterium]